MLPINPFLSLPEPDLRILNCIKKGDLETLEELKKEGFNWQQLTIHPPTFIGIYSNVKTEKGLRSFFNNLNTISWNEKYCECVAKLVYDLTNACEEQPNIEYVRHFLASGYDLHLYRNGEYVRMAIDCYNTDIALLLMANGATLSQWPGLLHVQISCEVSAFNNQMDVFGEADFELDAQRIQFMLEHGACVNTIRAYYGTYNRILIAEQTPLDAAIEAR